MLSDRDSFRFMVGQGLKKGLATVRGLRRVLLEEEQERVAEAIARARNEQLEDHPGRAWEGRRASPMAIDGGEAFLKFSCGMS